jgi:NAD+ synthase (glutamine-hydrolysing)
MHAAFEQSLSQTLESRGGEVARENIQARIRGNIIMAVSNAYSHLPLATGNKSELATGYCTLYGDMCGGLAPIGDLLKSDVYALGKHLNTETDSPRISGEILAKPPSAELKPNQTDQDKLPPYEVLDPILREYIERGKTDEEMIAAGCDPEIVREVIRMVDLAEYKRTQAPPVLRVTPRAFGTGFRTPIAHRYHREREK